MKKINYSQLKIFLCILFALMSRLLFSLDPAKEIHEYNYEVFSTDDGLPQSSVLCLIQSADGFLWMATYEGLARFDGVQFQVMDRANTPEMESNRIKTLFEDNQANLWIGTSEGILVCTNGKYKKITTQEGLSNDFVLSIVQDYKDNIWIGTTNGLNCLADNKITVFNHQHGLHHQYISALELDDEGNLWIGTSGGGLHILKTADGKIYHCAADVGLTGSEDIRVLCKNKEGGIWAGASGQGLIFIKDRKTVFYSEKNGLSGSDIRALFQDKHGVLWIGTNGQGLNRLKDGVFSCSAYGEGFLDRPIRTIMEDREGSLWIGTRDGLSQLKDGKFIIYNKRNGLPVDIIRTVYQDSKKNTWIGTVTGGLVKFTDNSFKTFGLEEGIKNEHIWTIAESSDGSIWIGTYGGGLLRLKNDKVIKAYTTHEGLGNNIIRAVCADNDNNIWVGTNGGGISVIHLKSGKIINYNSKNGLSDDFVYAVSEDAQGNIWIGSYRGTIDHFDKKTGKFTSYGKKEGLPGHAVWNIYPDKEGTIWIGTDGGGLLRLKNKQFTCFNIENGLYSDLAFQVLEDRSGNLWMNCNRGIYGVPKKNLADFAERKLTKISCFSYGRSEGIKNTECSGPAQPAGWCSKEGKLWFPTIRGLVVIDPGYVNKNMIPPPVVIEKMLADGRVIYSYPGNQVTGIELAAGTQRIEFKYTGLSFIAPERVRFKYKLEGFDSNWIDDRESRDVSYTNIAPGKYVFHVLACNNDGLWNKVGTNLAFVLKPFFWQTWWFRFLLVMTFAFFSYWLINFVKKHLKLIAFWKKKKYIGSYEIDEQIGGGGMGIVYRVHSLIDANHIFAMKVLKDEYLLDSIQQRRFKNESLLVDRLDHPNIVKVHERGEDKGQLYILMELLEGQTLGDRIKENRYPEIAQCIYIMIQVADVLVHLARENVIHRDLKPENIMLITKGNDTDFVKLLDFGIARGQTFSHLTETGHILGTLPYMPPEVVTDGLFTPAMDVYSLGVICYKLLTRMLPFRGDKPIETMRQIIDYTPPQPIELNPGIHPSLNELVLKMMSKDPKQRPSAQQVLESFMNIPPSQGNMGMFETTTEI
ncbi:MAG: protein kinase [Acidobacteria bacterium]|nr:protein kinase [Acidobacteriota bacterium]